MKKRIILVIVVSFLFLPSIVNAVCSLGANPLSASAKAIPGQTVVAIWNFYNLYGDRITHVKINQTEGPEWKITFEPELHTATYEVIGVIQTIEENVAIEPTSIVEEIPETIPEGMDYVKHPKEEGYIPVKPVKIYIEVPENAEIWKDYDFRFEAIGNCFMEPGAAVPGVATQFDLSVKTVTKEFKEEIIPEEKPISPLSAITGFITANLSISAVIISLAIIVIALTIWNIRIRRKLTPKRPRRKRR